MTINLKYNVIIILLLLIGTALYGQKLKSTGKIDNKGVIKVKGVAESSGQDAKIENKGTIIFEGNTWVDQDTLEGRVEYTRDDSSPIQNVPQLYYKSVYFKGHVKKYLDTTNGRYFIALDTLNTAAESQLELLPQNTIFARGMVTHNGQINVGSLYGRVKLDGTAHQWLDGTGQYKELVLFNSSGASIFNSGGFSVNTTLELLLGELRNDSTNNFIMSNSSLIVRNVDGSLAYQPYFEGTVSIQYIGNGSMYTGPEIPDSENVMEDLYVQNTGGINLSKSITVNDTLYMESSIRTEPDSANIHQLTYTSPDNPVFADNEAEIDGSIRRTGIRFDSTRNLFNNPFTYALFMDSTSANRMAEMTFRVKPNTFPPFDKGDMKVKRYISVKAMDSNNNPLKTGINMEMGYGWRDAAGSPIDETNSLPVPELILQRWTGSEWYDIESSMEPRVDSLKKWASSYSRIVSSLGDFAIGMPGGLQLVFRSRVFLEGPYRFGSMAMDLRMMNLVPTSPPAIYPYNLDPNRPFIKVDQIPDSVVDWIVLEFRPSFNSSEKYYRTVFLRTDGLIVELDGQSPVLLSKGGIDSGEYFIAVRHRNHLAIVTEDRIAVYPETAQNLIDFASPEVVMGRSSAIKPIGFDPKGSLLFGMIAGDVNGDGIINDQDLIQTWEQRDLEGYFSSDANMSGLINTRDFNYSWNNRGKVSNLP